MSEVASLHGGYWKYDLLDFHYLVNCHFPCDEMLEKIKESDLKESIRKNQTTNFLVNICHDIKTPINVLIAEVQINNLDNPILRSAEKQLNLLIDDLASASRITNGDFQFKKEIIKYGRKVNWYPSFYLKRLEDWTNNLGWNWCISRQRYFGVSIPVWYCKCGEIIMADEKELPVDPLQIKKKCKKCNAVRWTNRKEYGRAWS